MTTLTSAESGCYVEYGGRLYGYGPEAPNNNAPETAAMKPLGQAAVGWADADLTNRRYQGSKQCGCRGIRVYLYGPGLGLRNHGIRRPLRIVI